MPLAPSNAPWLRAQAKPSGGSGTSNGVGGGGATTTSTTAIGSSGSGASAFTKSLSAPSKSTGLGSSVSGKKPATSTQTAPPPASLSSSSSSSTTVPQEEKKPESEPDTYVIPHLKGAKPLTLNVASHTVQGPHKSAAAAPTVSLNSATVGKSKASAEGLRKSVQEEDGGEEEAMLALGNATQRDVDDEEEEELQIVQRPSNSGVRLGGGQKSATTASDRVGKKKPSAAVRKSTDGAEEEASHATTTAKPQKDGSSVKKRTSTATSSSHAKADKLVSPVSVEDESNAVGDGGGVQIAKKPKRPMLRTIFFNVLREAGVEPQQNFYDMASYLVDPKNIRQKAKRDALRVDVDILDEDVMKSLEDLYKVAELRLNAEMEKYDRDMELFNAQNKERAAGADEDGHVDEDGGEHENDRDKLAVKGSAKTKHARAKGASPKDGDSSRGKAESDTTGNVSSAISAASAAKSESAKANRSKTESSRAKTGVSDDQPSRKNKARETLGAPERAAESVNVPATQSSSSHATGAPSVGRRTVINSHLDELDDLLHSFQHAVLVCNVPATVTEDGLDLVLQSIANVHKVRIVRDQATGVGRGYAFCTMKSDEDLAKILESRHEVSISGHKLVFKKADVTMLTHHVIETMRDAFLVFATYLVDMERMAVATVKTFLLETSLNGTQPEELPSAQIMDAVNAEATSLKVSSNPIDREHAEGDGSAREPKRQKIHATQPPTKVRSTQQPNLQKAERMVDKEEEEEEQGELEDTDVETVKPSSSTRKSTKGFVQTLREEDDEEEEEVDVEESEDSDRTKDGVELNGNGGEIEIVDDSNGAVEDEGEGQERESATGAEDMEVDDEDEEGGGSGEEDLEEEEEEEDEEGNSEGEEDEEEEL